MDHCDFRVPLRELPTFTFKTKDGATWLDAIAKNREVTVNHWGVTWRGYVTQVHQEAIRNGWDIDGFEFTITFRASCYPAQREDTSPDGREAYATRKEADDYRRARMGDTIKVKTPVRYATHLEYGAAPKMSVPPGFYSGVAASMARDLERRIVGWDIAGLVKKDYTVKGILRKCDQTFQFNYDQPKEKKMKVRNKFYVAAPSVTAEHEQAEPNLEGKVPLAGGPLPKGLINRPRWTRHTLADALKHAEQMLEADPKLEHVAVTQIVRVVRRKKAPVVVEVVK